MEATETTATYDRDFAEWIRNSKFRAAATEATATEWTVWCNTLRITVKVTATTPAQARQIFKAQYGAAATSVLVEG